ncbi:LPXTG cell wall anchor domain-containing protein [Streptococcus suis]|uniref:LPXTG cell wall anchor domain-containing protein n=2 Tax=Streptococcus suis TaxID=1307 RepID=UPI0012900A84|nr:PT domain-containing protein [Streptococcus suis]MDG4507937.1 PT domain-containing protein [Streptococcus suis]
MQVKKFAKWGLALTSTLVLGGAIAPVGNQLLGGSAVVYAQDGAVFEPYVVEFYIDGEYWGVANRGYNSGWPYVRLEPYSEEFPGKEWPSEELGGFTSNLPNVSVVTKEDLDSIGSVVKVYWTRKPVETLPAETKPVEKTAEQPVEQPVEQPTEQPVATPADQPVEKPISVLIGAISEVDGPLSHYYVTINPGETKTVETPKVDGYKLDQYTSPTYELTYDNALKQLNSAGFAWVQFWMIKDAAPETPVEQPTEQPTEQPVEQPAEQPVEQPTEKPAETPTDKPVDTPTEKPAETPTGKLVDTLTDKPVEQLTDASSLTDQTAGKAQPVVTTDKKKVDKSAPSTPAVKPEEGSQTTAKTLPKTGDSSSMLLVLGGILSGLSGLGLAATSRKRD